MLRIPICKISSLASRHFFAMSSINSVKGMKDVVNEEMLKFEHIRRKGIEIFKKHGYQEVQPNILEHEELFQRSLGEASEIIQKEMYRFDDASGRKLVLRPEGTAGVVRMFIEKGMANTVLPRKFYYCGPMYRYENPQKGRQRQFYQLGVENIGSGDVFADIELLSMADSFMQSIKKKKNYYQIEINTLGDIESRAKYSQALKEYFTREDNYAKLSEISKTRLKLNNALRILDSKEKSDIDLVKDCPKIIDYLTENSKKNYKLIKDSLTRLGIDYNENPNLVRGLDYYTDLCFEIKYKNTEHEETKDTLMGGGRYDLLIGQLKGQKDLKDQVPAIGFGAGMERLMLALEDDDGWKENDKEYKKVGIAFIWDKNAASEVNSDLKLKGIEIPRLFGVEDKIIFEAAYHLNKIDKQMNYFDKKSFDYVVILGPDELKNKKVKVKDMRSGAQSMVDLQENFAEHFRNNFIDNKSA